MRYVLAGVFQTGLSAMQRTDPIESSPTGPQPVAPVRRGSGWARTISGFLRLVVGAILVVLGFHVAGSLGEAERFVDRSHVDALASIAGAKAASTMLVQMRADHDRLRRTSDRQERAALNAAAAKSWLSLISELGVIAGRARSVRTSQTAVAAQEAVVVWYEAAQRVAVGSAGDADDLDRLASVADVQMIQLAQFASKDGLAAHANAEAAIALGTRTVAGLCGGALVLVAMAAWTLVRRADRNAAAAADLVEQLASGGPIEPIPEHARGKLGPVLPAATKLCDRLRASQDASTGILPAGNRLANALDAARAGIVVIDAGDRIAYANAAALRQLGGSGDALRQGSGAAAVRAELDRLAEGGRSLPGDRRLIARCSAMPDGGLLAVLVEVDRQQDRDRANAADVNLQTALDCMSQGLCLYDASHRLAVMNRRYEEIYRLEAGTVRLGMSAMEVLERSRLAGNHPGKSLGELLSEAGQVLETCDQGEHFQEIDGGRVVQINACQTADGGFVATYEDVTERWHAEARIAYMARHDALTDLPNRLLLAEQIEGAVTQASRERGFAVHALDLDHFKQVNDTLGHAVGDELLRAVSHRLRACLRETDTVARLGGDEFAIVQADIERPEDAAVLARHVIDVLSAPYELTDHSVTIGTSIGIALAPVDGMAPDHLLKNADVALYRAKGDGRGAFRFFEPEMDARLQARRLLEIDLRAAIAAEAFELHYQPIYDLAQDRICGFEALLRWTHPTRGRVSPAEFVPLAEEIGLIVPLGEWVLRRACAEAAGWPGDLKIAVNVSPAQFRSAQLICTVRETLAETGLAPHRLELEITETVLMANRGATVAILHALRGLGARISMDDFGTGYSSLSYLRSFPFDKMKIDQSFIRDLTVENGSGFIVKAVISLGASLGMTMTAEGVETEAQLARLREEGCDEVQGYLFSPPVPTAQIPALLERWNPEAETARAA